MCSDVSSGNPKGAKPRAEFKSWVVVPVTGQRALTVLLHWHMGCTLKLRGALTVGCHADGRAYLNQVTCSCLATLLHFLSLDEGHEEK